MGVGTPHPTNSKTMRYSFFFFILSFVNSFASTVADVSPTDRSLLPPTGVEVQAVSSTSMTLSWQAPNSSSAPEVLSYVIAYSAADQNQTTVTVPADVRTKMVTELRPSTAYAVVVSAVYSGNRTASQPKFVVYTFSGDRPRGSCDCHEAGTLSCDPASGPGPDRCSCDRGYEGKRCDACKRDFYLSGDECRPCECSARTSTAECDINVQLPERRTCRCLPGHAGTNCTRCVHQHFWYEDRCLPCGCLHTCPTSSRRDPAACNDCDLKLNETKAGLESCGRNESGGRWAPRGEGTVALVAVLVSLGFIAIVAGSVTCYRYRSQRSNRHTFWSMELHEEKMSLNSACDYQRLDAAVAATGSSSAAAPSGAAPCEGPSSSSSSSVLRGREETRNGYHSMAM